MQLESTPGIQAVQFGGAFGLFVNGAWTLSNPLIATMSYFSTFDAALSDAQLHHLLNAYEAGGSEASCSTLFVVTGVHQSWVALLRCLGCDMKLDATND